MPTFTPVDFDPFAYQQQQQEQEQVPDRVAVPKGLPTYGLNKEGRVELEKARADRISQIQNAGAGADVMNASIQRAIDTVGGVLQESDTGGLAQKSFAGIPGARAVATAFGTDSEDRLKRMDAAMSAIKLAVGQAELKGQGAVSDRERELINNLTGGVGSTRRSTMLEQLKELQDIQAGKRMMADQLTRAGQAGAPLDVHQFDAAMGPQLGPYMEARRGERGVMRPDLAAVPENRPGAPRQPQQQQAGGDVFSQARDAIARGADPNQVRTRLLKMGVDPRGM